jgi:putative ABC transport system permease protein
VTYKLTRLMDAWAGRETAHNWSPTIHQQPTTNNQTMFRFAPYVLKTLWRHRSRTVLTLSGSAVALFVFCCVGAVQEAMNDLRRRQESKGALVVFQANKFCPATSHLPQDYERRIGRVAGVREVVPIQVFTNNCRASLDVVVFHGLPSEKLRMVRSFELIEGDWSDFEQRQDAAMVGSAVAERRRLDVGDKFSIGGITVSVAGVYSSDDAAEENYVYTGLDFLQRGNGPNRVGTVTQFEIALAQGADAIATCQRIDEAFQTGPVETTTRSKGAFQAKALGDLAQFIGMTHYLGYACVGLVLILVATTTVMSVQDRVKEHAVLQTVGFSGQRVFCLILAESVLLSLLGGTVGVAVAWIILEFSSLAVGAEGVMMAFRPSLRMVFNGLAVSLLSGLLGGLVPAWQAARTEIVPALRHT